jgi:hypothetical protein
VGLHEEEIDGSYALVLEFDSTKVPFSTWVEKKSQKLKPSLAPVCGPNSSQPEDDRVNLALITLLEPATVPVEA